MHRTSRIFVSLAAVALASMLLAGALTPMQAFAGEQHKPRPVWRGWSARTHDDKQAEYIRFLDKIHHEELKAWKAAGLLTDYKVLIHEPRGPDDPDVTIMYQYASAAAMDRPSKLWAEVSKKALEKSKNDPEAQKMMAESDSLRRFIGWFPMSREVVWEED